MRRHPPAPTAALALLLSLASPVLAQVPDGWSRDFAAASEQAARADKDVLVVFTQLQRSSWCRKLRDRVLSQPTFREPAQDTFELSWLDAASSKLRRTWGAPHNPTLVLLTPAGDVYARVRYRVDGPEAYLHHLLDLRQRNRDAVIEARELAASIAKAKPEARTARLTAVLDAIAAKPPAPAKAILIAGISKSLTLVRDDEALKRRVTTTLLRAGQGSPALLQWARDLDPENGTGLLELTLIGLFRGARDDAAIGQALAQLDAIRELGFHDNTRLASHLETALRWSLGRLDDKERATGYAKALAPLLGDSDTELRQLVERLMNDGQR